MDWVRGPCNTQVLWSPLIWVLCCRTDAESDKFENFANDSNDRSFDYSFSLCIESRLSKKAQIFPFLQKFKKKKQLKTDQFHASMPANHGKKCNDIGRVAPLIKPFELKSISPRVFRPFDLIAPNDVFSRFIHFHDITIV